MHPEIHFGQSQVMSLLLQYAFFVTNVLLLLLFAVIDDADVKQEMQFYTYAAVKFLFII